MLESLTFLAALGAALNGGIFFAFSTFVMRALGQLRPEDASRAMQRINAAVLNPAFLAAFIGAAVVSVAAFALAAAEGLGTSYWHGLGCAAYLGGCIGITGVRNVPLNERLAEYSPVEAARPEAWRAYAEPWTRWNHVRAAAGLLAAACFIQALR